MTHRMPRALLGAAAWCLPFAVCAIGTPAGTEIRNQAEISFVLNGTAEARQSNSTTLRVLELLDVSLLAQTAERVVDAAGVSRRRAAAIGRYLVAGVPVTVQTSAAISDASGGSVPSSGATVVYTIRVSAVGQRVAAAAVLHDVTPAPTTHVAGSLALNAPL
jgi:uncharacterized repeat protein (TIGR01451 family)